MSLFQTLNRNFSRVGLATMVICGLILATGSVALAKAKPGKKADQALVVLGTVTTIEGNSITLESKKGGSKQFQLTDDTKYQQAGKKGSDEKPVARADVKAGQRVAVTAKGDQAQTIVIESKQKKGKKAT
jgi:hypothetical protein